MVDILKITSPIAIKNKVQNLPKQLPTDAVFDLTNPNAVKNKTKTQGAEEDSSKQTLLQNLNKEIFEPLMNSTKVQSESIKKLIMLARIYESSSGIISESFLEKIFIKPEQMLKELLIREKGETIFKGEFFDSLRLLAKLEGQPALKSAITNILKYFDCYVNENNSLSSIIVQSNNLSSKLPKGDMQLLEQLINNINTLMQSNAENHKYVKTFLRNEFIPLLGKILKKHQNNENIHKHVMSIVHNIVRFDKADPKRLEEAIINFGEELKPLTNISDDDIVEMKRLLFDHGKKAREMVERPNLTTGTSETFEMDSDVEDIVSLLSKAFDKAGPAKINNAAQNLLLYMVQSESPILPLMHFIIPFRYLDQNTYGEFFIDKDCRERKGDAKDAKNIFFTIQSDKYGSFEVDLLARDKRIDLDIKCPDLLVDNIKDIKLKVKDIIEESGYRLTNYQVGAYRESQTILQRFPKLALRKVGVDVKI